ncbi:MAG: phosphoribosyl-AMP cyclohydrolase [Ktedonobacteraceae bacterium]|nr:phosphoribosyl-AMP cyclohydrolase [Ktedonobacteraceae bacterium]
MLKFDNQGLIPVVIVDDATGNVLMVASMNQEALQQTRATGFTHLFSRSRNKLWRKGEQSGNVQEVRSIFINCEENSLLVRVHQHGGAACHDGYYSCYYRRLLPNDTYQTVSERVFDPKDVYQVEHPEAAKTERADVALAEEDEESQASIASIETNLTDESDEAHILPKLDTALRQLYGVYLYLRDHDMTTESNTSRLLHEKSKSYLTSRLADELQELAGVQSGEHVHIGLQDDTALEGSQVGYWLFLLASTNNVPYNSFTPHAAILHGYTGQYSEEKSIELRQECLQLVDTDDPVQFAQGLEIGFSIIGWACSSAGISPLAPAEFDLDQMRRKGLV